MDQHKRLPYVPVTLANGSLDGRDVGQVWPINQESAKEGGSGVRGRDPGLRGGIASRLDRGRF